MSGVALDAVQKWACPNCSAYAVTFRQTNRFHPCSGLGGLTAPMVRAGTRCQVRAVVREDYVGTEDVTYDDSGRPVMAVVTERPDGSNDVAVYAPTVHMRIEG